MNDIGLYVHIPFCMSKCHYCSFNSVELRRAMVRPYLDALKMEMEMHGRKLSLEGAKVATIYVGGGTPTCLDASEILEIVEEIRRHFDLEKGAEVTVEANAGTLSEEKLQALKDGGVNRLSIGLQSSHDELLKRLGRIHTFRDFEKGFSLAREAGISNINVDLIFAIPGESMEDWLEDLARVTDLGPEHISTYNLTLEEGTRLWGAAQRGEIELPGEDLDCEMYEAAIAFLENNSYQHYEISNFARSGKRCHHNLIYWKNGDYLGIGAGAHSHLQGRRHFNVKDLQEYSGRVRSGRGPIEGVEEPSLEREMYDYLMMGLRLLDGISKREFRGRFGREFSSVFGDKAVYLESLGLLEIDDVAVRLTRRGLLLANEVFVEFLP